jgi:hypothetical protein
LAGRHSRIILVTMLSGTMLAGPAMAEATGIDKGPHSEDRLQPGIYPIAPVPEAFAVPLEPGHSPFDVDWSVGLKGSYTHTNTGESFIKTVSPQFSAVHAGSRTDLTLGGSAELAQPAGGDITLTGLKLGVDGRMALDSVTAVTGNAAFDISRQLPDLPGLPSAVTRPADVVTGSAGLGIDRQFGKFNVGVTGSAARHVYGTSLRTDTGLTDNSDQNYWAADAGLRVGYQVTPIFEVFGQGNIGRDMFDLPSATMGVLQDGSQRALRAGCSRPAHRWAWAIIASTIPAPPTLPQGFTMPASPSRPIRPST